MEACNLDAGGVHKRRTGGLVVVAVGLGVAAWQIQAGHPPWVRVLVALALFGFGFLALFQARAKT